MVSYRALAAFAVVSLWGGEVDAGVCHPGTRTSLSRASLSVTSHPESATSESVSVISTLSESVDPSKSTSTSSRSPSALNTYTSPSFTTLTSIIIPHSTTYTDPTPSLSASSSSGTLDPASISRSTTSRSKTSSQVASSASDSTAHTLSGSSDSTIQSSSAASSTDSAQRDSTFSSVTSSVASSSASGATSLTSSQSTGFSSSSSTTGTASSGPSTTATTPAGTASTTATSTSSSRTCPSTELLVQGSLDNVGTSWYHVGPEDPFTSSISSSGPFPAAGPGYALFHITAVNDIRGISQARKFGLDAQTTYRFRYSWAVVPIERDDWTCQLDVSVNQRLVNRLVFHKAETFKYQEQSFSFKPEGFENGFGVTQVVDLRVYCMGNVYDFPLVTVAVDDFSLVEDCGAGTSSTTSTTSAVSTTKSTTFENSPSNTPHNTPSDSASTTTQNSPSNSPSTTPHNTPSITPENTPTSASHTTPKNTPQNTPSTTAHNTPQNTPSTTPQNTPSTTPQNTTSTTPQSTPQNTPSTTPTNSPSNSPSNSPQNTPSTTPKETPENTPTPTPTPTPGCTPPKNYIQNGGFEEEADGGDHWDLGEVEIVTQLTTPTDPKARRPNTGKRYARATALHQVLTNPGSLTQDITGLTIGNAYTLSFSWAFALDLPSHVQTATCTIDIQSWPHRWFLEAKDYDASSTAPFTYTHETVQIPSMPAARIGLDVYVDCGTINSDSDQDIYYTLYVAFDDFSLVDAGAPTCPSSS